MRQAKDMSVIRESMGFWEAIKKNSAVLKDYRRGTPVFLQWDMSNEAKRDRMFRIRIGDQEAILDLEELLSYTRVM